MKKLLSLLISGLVASSLLAGCANNIEKESEKEAVIIQHQDEQSKVVKEKEVSKKKEEAQEEAQEIKKQNKVVDKNEAKENKTTDTKKENTSSKIKQYKVVSDKPNKAKQDEASNRIYI